MRLYHGSNADIGSVDLSVCRPYKDFGRGFYTTDISGQAMKMAERVARIYGGKPVVNVYSVADDFLNTEGLSVRNFGNVPTEEWARFVMNNRDRSFKDTGSDECNSDCKYDIVAGPVADDDMTMLFRQFQSGLISAEALIRGMTFKSTTSQFSFHTVRAAALLQKEGRL